VSDDKYKDIISKLKNFKSESYQSLDLDRLLTYAMNVLDDHEVPLYFDYISICVFRLFPKKFSMAIFEEYPDTNRISKALRRLTDAHRRNWATGNIENGFNLTEAGKEIYKQVNQLLKSPAQIDRKMPKRTRGRSTQDDATEILNSELYKKWKQDAEISEFEVSNFLGASPYTPKALLAKHLENLKLAAETSKNLEVDEFLNWLEDNFNYVFRD